VDVDKIDGEDEEEEDYNIGEFSKNTNRLRFDFE
jgi:hypothetical protein